MKTTTIYTTDTCHFCHLAKDFFKEQDIAYTEKNVGSDLEARQEMIEKSGQMGVPFITIEEEGQQPKMIVGFDRASLVTALGIEA